MLSNSSSTTICYELCKQKSYELKGIKICDSTILPVCLKSLLSQNRRVYIFFKHKYSIAANKRIKIFNKCRLKNISL